MEGAGSLPTHEDTKIITAAELKAQRRKKHNINVLHQEGLNFLERMAVWITEHIGTMGFFLMILAWTALWLSWNALAARFGWPGVFDKPYEFGIWLFISNVIQLFLMPLLLLGQNLLGRHSELRAEQEFHLTEQTEREMEVALRYLEHIHHRLIRVSHKLEDLEKRGQAVGGA